MLEKPKVGEFVEAYFGNLLLTELVVEWRGDKCFFSNGWYLVWGGDHIGFLL